jgi:hypothetical protein
LGESGPERILFVTFAAVLPGKGKGERLLASPFFFLSNNELRTTNDELRTSSDECRTAGRSPDVRCSSFAAPELVVRSSALNVRRSLF